MEKHINHFLKFAAKELNLSKMPKINLVGHSEDQKKTFGHYANDDSVTVRAKGRHPLDVMRTLAHELTHYKQKSNKLKPVQAKEDEANAVAGRIMRKYDEQNPKIFSEDATAASAVPANAVGDQGISASSLGPIQGFSPLLGKKKDEKRTMLSRIAPSSSLTDKAGEKGKSLRDIIGKNKADKDMKKEKKFINPFGV